MKRLRTVSLIVLLLGTAVLCGCYFAIPTVVEAVNQNRIIAEEEGALPVAHSGALKLIRIDSSAKAQKLDAYIRGYNHIMVGQLSLLPSYRTFTEHTLKSRPADTISFPVIEHLDEGLASIRKGLSIDEETLTELDGVMDEALVAGEKLLADETTSLQYFRSHMYRRDNMQGAHKVFPVLQKDYENLISALKRAGDMLLDLQKSETLRQMAAYRAQKTMIGFYTEKAMLHAQELVMLDVSSPEKGITTLPDGAGAKILTELKVALNTQQKILNDVYPMRDRAHGVDVIVAPLRDMAVQYDQIERNYSLRAWRKMMNHYNRAVINYNTLIENPN